MEQLSWIWTVVTQISLCCGLYLALNLGKPQSTLHHHSNTINGPLDDIYFISVNGGFRPLAQQTVLLEQMEKVANTYDAKFILSIGDLGEKDPLWQNATKNYRRLSVPWYTTKAPSESDESSSLKKLRLPDGRTLGIIALDTGSLQDPSGVSRNVQLHRLARMLNVSYDHWRIVIGLHPLATCTQSNDQVELRQIYDLVRYIFQKYEVNAYLSGPGCTYYKQRRGVAYISHPGPERLGSYNVSSEEPLDDGFLVHRVSFVEIETFFVTLNGKVVHKVAVRQRGVQAV